MKKKLLFLSLLFCSATAIFSMQSKLEQFRAKLKPLDVVNVPLKDFKGRAAIPFKDRFKYRSHL
jgi:hypothetical protein